MLVFSGVFTLSNNWYQTHQKYDIFYTKNYQETHGLHFFVALQCLTQQVDFFSIFQAFNLEPLVNITFTACDLSTRKGKTSKTFRFFHSFTRAYFLLNQRISLKISSCKKYILKRNVNPFDIGQMFDKPHHIRKSDS